MRAGRGYAMAITYYKRFRMEINLDQAVTMCALPRGFVWVPWSESLMDQHAEVKYRSFIGEVDAFVFPCLGDRHGCRRLMGEIRRKPGFLPGATWLIACDQGYVGTVQGVADRGDPERGGRAQSSGDGAGASAGPAHAGRVSPGGAAAGLSRSDGGKCRRRSALSRRRVSSGQNALQSSRWLEKGTAGKPAVENDRSSKSARFSVRLVRSGVRKPDRASDRSRSRPSLSQP